MEINKILENENFESLTISNGTLNGDGIYCCDLLSIAMSSIPENYVWITVMANVNTLAVATLSDVSCIVISCGMEMSESDIETAKSKGLNLIKTNLDTYSASILIKDILNL